MKRNWKIWLGVLVAILIAGEGFAWLLWAQGWGPAGAAAAWAGRLAATAWMVRGLWVWRDLPWVQRETRIILGTLGAALLILFGWQFGYPGLMIAVAGAYLMAVAFVYGLLLMRMALSPGHPILGVARTLLDEAIRMKVALVFIVALVLTVPVLPLVMDPAEVLKYRVQSFLTYSLMATGVLLSAMTIFLAVGTITREMSQRQIFLTMTKPVSRAQYLAGKWLGIALLNVLLVSVCGGGIYVFTQMLSRGGAAVTSEYQRAQVDFQRMEVQQEVLAARVAVVPEGPANAVYHERMDMLRQQDPGTYGQPGEPVSNTLSRQVQQQVLGQWYTIGPRQTRTYVFRDVRPPTDGGQWVQLRLKPQAAGALPDPTNAHLGIRVNGRHFHPQNVAGTARFSVDSFHVLRIPVEAIEFGELRIALSNPEVGGAAQPSISFGAADGLQVLYRAGGFEANLVRSLTMLWIRLGFLAMLGLAAGTFMTFPSAALLSMMVYITAAASGFMHESLAEYAALPGAEATTWQRITGVPAQVFGALAAGEIGGALRIVVRLFGQGFMLLVPSFGDYNPTPLLSDGQLVSWRQLGRAAWQVGLLWTGVTGVVAWLIFRKRELARVTV